MPRVLVLAWDPRPPIDGGNIHVHNVLKRVGGAAEIHLACLRAPGTAPDELAAEGQAPDGARGGFEGLGLDPARVRVFDLPAFTPARRLQALASPWPPGCRHVEASLGAALRGHVAALRRGPGLDLLHVWGAGMAGSLAGAGLPGVLTAGDAFSLVHASFAAETGPPRSLYHRLVARRFRRYERRVYPRYDAVAFFSERDREAAGLPDGVRQLVLPNGVDAEAFRPRRRLANATPVLVFHGNLDYAPNLDAVRFLILEVGPALAASLGKTGFRLRIIGRGAASRLSGLICGCPWLELTGYVDDLPAALASTDLYLAPVFSGAGIKNKVLEALATGLPVVGTAEAFAALGLADGVHAAVARRADFVERTLALLANPPLRERLGTAARDLVRGRFSWDIVAAAYLDLYRELASCAGGAAQRGSAARGAGASAGIASAGAAPVGRAGRAEEPP
ncbi:MAG: glycosyltransferase [Candidatus Krumholzibacteriota bacterium]|nr:glycosyltransferase [Candidatus Krumholzibacteriota bacterium]